MPVFNVASTFSKKSTKGGAAETYNAYVDQLSILENQLETDGKLSPGDYDLLTETAKKFYLAPGLTPGQRSNIEVKMSAYKKGKGNVIIKDSTDFSQLNDEMDDSLITNIRALGNNPQLFLQANHDAAMAKVARLSDMVDAADDGGADSTKTRMEYLQALNDAQEAQQDLQDMALYQKGGAPTSKRIAFIDTNDKGEITSVRIGRPGDNAKYVPTNGVYGGMQVYGMPNGVESGNKVFKLGDQQFEAPDIIEPDPENPLATRVRPLMSKDTLKSAGKISTGQISVYKDIDQNNVKVQSLIPNGGWAKGRKGAIYKRGENGKYTKYLNATLDQLGVTPNNVISLPQSFENTLVGDVENTVDSSLVNVTPPPMTQPEMAPEAAESYPVGPAAGPSYRSSMGSTGGSSRTPAPVERAPSSSGGIASRAYNGAKNFLASVFRS